MDLRVLLQPMLGVCTAWGFAASSRCSPAKEELQLQSWLLCYAMGAASFHEAEQIDTALASLHATAPLAPGAERSAGLASLTPKQPLFGIQKKEGFLQGPYPVFKAF